MTPFEHRAIRGALRTADFSRSPGLRARMERSLREPPEWGLLGCIILGVAVWLTLAWAML
jgi:hypothetical protein